MVLFNASVKDGTGSAVLLKQDIQRLVKLDYSTENIQALWLCCDGSLFNVDGSFLMGAVYINLETLGRKKDFIEICFEDLLDDTLTATSGTEHVILMGDFNANFNAIGSLNEFIDEHFDLFSSLHHCTVQAPESCISDHYAIVTCF
mgnify:CR=1 FL=1